MIIFACTLGCVHAYEVTLVVSNSLQPYELSPARLLCPWESPVKNTGVGSHSLFQGVFLTQEMEPASITSPALAGRFYTAEPPGKPCTLGQILRNGIVRSKGMRTKIL